MKPYTGKLGLYSNLNSFDLLLIQKIKEKGIEVLTFDTLQGIDYSQFDYIIFDLLSNPQVIIDLDKIAESIDYKAIVLFPLYVNRKDKEHYDKVINQLLTVNDNLGVVLVPEMIGSGIEFNEVYRVHNLIKQSILSERVKINDNSGYVNIVSTISTTNIIVKNLFSFGIGGHRVSLTGYRRTLKSILNNNLNIKDENIIFSSNENDLVELEKDDISKVHFSFRLALSRTKKSFLDRFEVISTPTIPNTNKITNSEYLVKPQAQKNKKIKYLLNFLSTTAFILLIPVFVLLISASLFYFSYKLAFKNPDYAERFIAGSIEIAKFSQQISFLPHFFDYSNLLVKSGEIFNEFLYLSRASGELASKIITDKSLNGQSESNSLVYADSLSAIIDNIFVNTSFLQSDLNSLGISFGRERINSYRESIYNVKTFFSRTPTLLGLNKPAKYLVVFQNNMELRPTGGFIGSFALITFDKGKLTEIVVSDVYSADGQLKGHVDPPEAIRKHLGEGGWYMRDANWDPSFPESAKKIEWFLDKEINVQVDGVIGVDLYFVKKLLELTGPIVLSDFDKTITSSNFYSNIQNEVEENFFPGSIKKTTILNSLVGELIDELQSISKNKYNFLAKALYESLVEKHVQVYLHDSYAQKAISDLGFSGDVVIDKDCGQRCIYDSYALIDANLGVNKSNQFITKSQDVFLNINKDKTTHSILVSYENNASPVFGESAKYKNYVRILIPRASKVLSVKLDSGFNNNQEVDFESVYNEGYKEIGFLFEVNPKEIKKIQIDWETDNLKLENGGEYDFNIRKQAGIDSEHLKVKTNSQDFSLTSSGTSGYTTILNKDFSTKIFLTPK